MNLLVQYLFVYLEAVGEEPVVKEPVGDDELGGHDDQIEELAENKTTEVYVVSGGGGGGDWFFSFLK